MKKIIPLIILFIGMYACNSTQNMTIKERAITNNGAADVPFSILKTNIPEDSLFLRKKSVDISEPKNIATNKDLQLLIQRLENTMKAASGVGIAAPQVGVGVNVFLFMRIDKPDMPVAVAINPVIKDVSEETIDFEGDGCLSIPGLSGTTKRYAWIEVEYYNREGTLIREKLAGTSRQGDFTGVIFQHEYDHLQGVLFTDRLVE